MTSQAISHDRQEETILAVSLPCYTACRVQLSTFYEQVSLDFRGHRRYNEGGLPSQPSQSNVTWTTTTHRRLPRPTRFLYRKGRCV
jgi:hypothetical protein